MIQIVEFLKVAYRGVNPYAIEVLRTKKNDLLYGILHTEELLDLLTSEGVISTMKKSIILKIRTKTEQNLRILEFLEANGERACRKFFHPCLMLAEPELYSQIKSYVVSLNENIRDSRRQLIGYLTERDGDMIQDVTKKKSILELVPPVKNPKTIRESARNSMVVDDSEVLDPKLQPRQSMELSIEQGLNQEDIEKGDKLGQTLDDGEVIVEDKSSKDKCLHKAAQEDDWKMVEDLLKNGVDIDAKDEENKMALWYAVANGHEKTIDALVKAGAKIDSGIMSEAMKHNKESVVRMLLENSKGDVSEEDLNSAIFSAVRQNKDGVLLALIDSGANVNVLDQEGYTPLLLSAKMGHARAFRVLIEHEANLDATLPDRSSTVHLAVQGGSVSILEKLLEKGCNPNSTGPKAYTPLHVAAEFNRAEMIGALLKAGAQVNATAQDGLTPLHISSQHGHEDTVVHLLKGKAKLESRDKLGRTALHWASVVPGEGNVVQVLLSSKSISNALDHQKRSPLHLASMEGNLNTVTLLLSHKAKSGARDKNGSTPLHYAAAGGHGSVVSALLRTLKKKHLEEKNIWKKNALHLAAEKGHGGVIVLLLEAGANINAADQNKDTPLHGAVRGGHLEAVKTIVGWGGQGGQDKRTGKKADLQATNSLGKTPLQVAEETGEQENIVVLLKRKMLLVK